MKKLNLHGKRHYEVDRIVENFIIDTYNRDELPTEIITGNSKKIREEKLSAMALKVADIKGIGYYSLGSHRKNLSDEKKKEYLEIIEKYRY